MGHRLAVADSGGLRIWDIDTSSQGWLEKLRHTACAAQRAQATPDHSSCRLLPVASSHFTNVAISADGQVLAAGREDGTVQVWNLTDQQPVPTSLPRPHHGRVTGIALSRDGRHLASAGVDGFIDISRPDGTDMRTIRPNPAGAIFTVAFDRAADRLAAGGADGGIQIGRAHV